MRNLEPMAMPLRGANLIEASAGTGKTYTITALYLRLLLGFNDQNQPTSPLLIDQILVVTFTEAATAEIKDRVRQRLMTLRDKLLGKETSDEIVNQLFDLIDDPKRAFSQIDHAVKSLDDAAIFTIHGFCQRMLKQHAFESGMAFDLQFIMDQSELLDTAIKDFWRQFVFPLEKEQYAAVINCFRSPEVLQKALYGLLVRHNINVTPHYTVEEALRMQHTLTTKVASLKKQVVATHFVDFIKGVPFKKSKPIASSKNLALLEAFCHSDDTVFQGASKRSFEIWSSQSFAEQSNYLKDKTPVSHELSTLFDEVSELLEKSREALPVAIVRAAHQYVIEWLVDEKQKQQLINPDDLLINLSNALVGKNSSALAEAILSQFPVALIDEFQDTDPIQYGIFSRIYLDQAMGANEESALIMIGDPKQAIYGFRGADIFTYIDAKHQVLEEAHYTLDTNYRSSQEIVSSVNTLFARKENSFIFNNDIPFVPVNAKGKSDAARLRVNDEVKTGLHFCVYDVLDETVSKTEGEMALASICSEQIARLLMGTNKGEVTIEGRALAAGDIAILVRDRNQANIIKRALQKRGVSSVFLSRDSVFQSGLATHLLTFLNALIEPYNEATFRGILVGPLFSLDYSTVYNLAQDLYAWENVLEQFTTLKQLLHKKGVMAVIETLIDENELPQRWAEKGWEVPRQLTDIRHLGELLQQKHLELNSYRRLCHWLFEQVTQYALEGTQLRLETDQQLVNIVTMHGSKGLEYPVVFMPFSASFKENQEAVYHTDSGSLVYDLAPNDEANKRAAKESLAEDLRLLYVALTRAVHYLVVGLYNIKDGRKKAPGIAKTPLGHLLFESDDIDTGHDWYTQLKRVCDENTGLSVELYSKGDATVLLESVHDDAAHLHVKEVERQVPNRWYLTSFSALTKHDNSDNNAFDYKQGANDESHLLDWTMNEASQLQNEMGFPKGANAGSCLHAIMENIDFAHPDNPQVNEKQLLAEVVEKQLNNYQISLDWVDIVSEWVRKVLVTALSPINTSLSRLDMSKCLIEMEFMLPVNNLVTNKLNEILLKQSREHFTPLSQATVSGMLKGFIDLIFYYDGQYFVLDYKSNYLGDSGDDYSVDNMESVMSSHHYHLQYLLYTVALHRLLKQRIKHYNMREHLGGSLYLFLRGMPAGQGIYYKAPDFTLIKELDTLFDKGAFHA